VSVPCVCVLQLYALAIGVTFPRPRILLLGYSLSFCLFFALCVLSVCVLSVCVLTLRALVLRAIRYNRMLPLLNRLSSCPQMLSPLLRIVRVHFIKQKFTSILTQSSTSAHAASSTKSIVGRVASCADRVLLLLLYSVPPLS
jgi:hypothetical protein